MLCYADAISVNQECSPKEKWVDGRKEVGGRTDHVIVVKIPPKIYRE